jgi:hypothetical protein
VANRDLLTVIRRLHHDSRQTYGSLQLCQALRAQASGLGNIAWRGSGTSPIFRPRPSRNGG